MSLVLYRHGRLGRKCQPQQLHSLLRSEPWLLVWQLLFIEKCRHILTECDIRVIKFFPYNSFQYHNLTGRTSLQKSRRNSPLQPCAEPEGQRGEHAAYICCDDTPLAAFTITEPAPHRAGEEASDVAGCGDHTNVDTNFDVTHAEPLHQFWEEAVERKMEFRR